MRCTRTRLDRWSARSAAVLACGAALLLTAPAVADETSALEERRAQLYREGREFADGGQWEDAMKRFEEVVRIRSAPKALIALGVAQEHAGRLLAALASYRQAAGDAATAKDSDVVATATGYAQALEPKVPVVVVELPRDGDGKVLVDARAAVELRRSLGASAQPVVEVLVDPGKRVIEVRQGERALVTRTISIEAGQRIRVSGQGTVAPAESTAPAKPAEGAARPAPSGTDAPAQPPPPVEAHDRPVVPIAVLGGVGAVSLGVGLVLRIGGTSDYDTATASCVGARCGDRSAVQDGNDARSRIVLGDVLAVAGGVALAGAAVWWFGSAPPAGEVRAARAPRWGVGVLPSTGGGRAAVFASF